MKFTPPVFKGLREMSYIDVARLTEDEARKILEDIRWAGKVKCIHCGSENVSRVTSKSKSTRDGLILCNACRKQFTVTVGTIMEGSHITLRQWIQAFTLMCTSKKGISALQLQRQLGLHTYRAALHLTHRIRLAMKQKVVANMLKGIVEVDETYVGGKPRKGSGEKNKRGRGTDKTPVITMVERNGNSVSFPIEKVDKKTLRGAINGSVDKRSTIMTDEWKGYNGVGVNFNGGHLSVNHSAGEYSNGDISTNTAESYFALLKRGVIGTFHHISKKHLHRYCDEFSFRWNNKEVTDGVRTENAVRGIFDKHLSYKSLTGGKC